MSRQATPKIDYQALLEEIAVEVKPLLGQGKVASYIPALERVPGDKFGMAVTTLDGKTYATGEAREPFSVQSITKVFTLGLAMSYLGTELWQRVGREPSGTPFNSLIQLENEHGVPRNPFINAGALVSADVLAVNSPEPKNLLRNFVRRNSGNPEIDYDLEVARSEAETGHRNAAIAHFMKAHGNIHAAVETVLDIYFTQCSLAMSCVDLSRCFLHLANQGRSPITGDEVTTPRKTRRINALMLTCGLYDAAGRFAYHVGLPAKSGVGGGIVAVAPRQFAVCVWSPELDASGNSVLGAAALEHLTNRTGVSIF
jgi:glutaminase